MAVGVTRGSALVLVLAASWFGGALVSASPLSLDVAVATAALVSAWWWHSRQLGRLLGGRDWPLERRALRRAVEDQPRRRPCQDGPG